MKPKPTTSTITIEDIAEHAGVSISTVSRVLRGSAPVSEKKRLAVEQAIAQLQYEPNLFASSLASGESRTIGILTQDISSPILDTMLRSVLQGLEASGYAPIIADGYWQAKREQAAVQLLLSLQVDGLVMVGGALPESFLLALEPRLPFVLVGRNLPALAHHCLYLDNFLGGYQATRYLLDRGHRQIVHITGDLTHEDARERQQGYWQALQSAGIEPDPSLVVQGNFLEASGKLAVEMLLTEGVPFSAIFAGNDQMALGARLALYRNKLRVPEDVSLIGYDDQPAAGYMTPPLTTVSQPAQEMGLAAAGAILQKLRGERVPFQSVKFLPRLVVRESVAQNRMG
jgi:LacI family transcriptional regulator